MPDTQNGSRPKAVLLDVGGIFLLPDHDRIIGAFERALCPSAPAPELLDQVHYVAASHLTTDLDVEADWAGCWKGYLERYIEACGVPTMDHEEAHRHLDSEFADAALWVHIVPGCRDELQALADTGVRLGIVSNADGLIGARLAEMEILQVGPGAGVPVDCIIDSGAVGVMKPDARIFHMALEAMAIEPSEAWYVGDMPAIDVTGARRAGLRPFVMDPLGLHAEADYDSVVSLGELAERVRSTG
jgi:HAD superfamily hydrolase (TIGR01662 family)